MIFEPVKKRLNILLILEFINQQHQKYFVNANFYIALLTLPLRILKKKFFKFINLCLLKKNNTIKNYPRPIFSFLKELIRTVKKITV